jgi:hypothetical protein
VATFLSAEWFDELGVAYEEGESSPDGPAGHSPDGGTWPLGEAPGPAAPGRLVVGISVTGAPQGEVRYQVVVDGAQARVLPPGARFLPAQVELSSDYVTMAGIASGELPAIDALSLGRARVSGDTAALSSGRASLAGLDLVPPAVRARTTF